jgi:hypothetical protein
MLCKFQNAAAVQAQHVPNTPEIKAESVIVPNHTVLRVVFSFLLLSAAVRAAFAVW